MDRKIVYSMTFFSEEIDVKIVKKWCNFMGDVFAPTYMNGKYISAGKSRKYNEKKFYDNLYNEIAEGINIRLTDMDNSLWITRSAQAEKGVIITIILNEKSDLSLEGFFEQMMIDKGIVATKSVLSDDSIQNIKDIDTYKLSKGDLKGVKVKHCESGRVEIDTEYNPGHSHYLTEANIWFGSCYKMWFGKPYYDYISKEKLKNFSNCYENIELANEVIRITLYEDIWAYDEKKNRKIQWDFRKSVGMDEVAHALENVPKNKETDASIEITNGIFPNGGVKMIKYYYDSSNELISKSKAVKVRICEFAQDGTLLFEEEKEM